MLICFPLVMLSLVDLWLNAFASRRLILELCNHLAHASVIANVVGRGFFFFKKKLSALYIYSCNFSLAFSWNSCLWIFQLMMEFDKEFGKRITSEIMRLSCEAFCFKGYNWLRDMKLVQIVLEGQAYYPIQQLLAFGWAYKYSV